MTASDVIEIAWSTGGRRASPRPRRARATAAPCISDRRSPRGSASSASLPLISSQIEHLAALRVAGRRVAEVAGRAVRRASRRSAAPAAGRGPSARAARPSCSGVALRPSIALAASPGSTSVPAKTRIETTSSVEQPAASGGRRTSARAGGAADVRRRPPPSRGLGSERSPRPQDRPLLLGRTGSRAGPARRYDSSQTSR